MSDEGGSAPGVDEVQGETQRERGGRMGRLVGARNKTVAEILAKQNPDVGYTMVPAYERLDGARLRRLLQ